jgi:hypothetical protein
MRRRDEEDFALFVDAGAVMLNPEREWCRQEIAAHLKHGRGAEDMVEILAGGIRTVAKRSPTVGRGLLAASLPLKGVIANLREGFFGATAQLIDDDNVTTFNLNPDDSTPTWEAPHMVCDGVLLGGQVVSTTKEEVTRRMGRRQSMRPPRP